MNTHESISVIIPILNEEDSLKLLISRIVTVLEPLGVHFEIIAVNDGSTDQSQLVLAELAQTESRLKVIRLARNFGQTAAMMSGFDHSQGTIIVPIDSDLQNDPGDIPRLLAKLDEGFDVVSGWRRYRKDALIRRNFLSRRANWLISRMSGVSLHDYGCSLKAYRRAVIGQVKLYGEMHRFIPIYASWYDARIAELDVTHYPRQIGKSKYGMMWILKVIRSFIFRNLRAILFDYMIPRSASYRDQKSAIDPLNRAVLSDIRAPGTSEMSWTVVGRRPSCAT